MLSFGLIGGELDTSPFPKCILGLSATADTGIFNHTFNFLGDFDITVSFATTYRDNQILFGDAHLLTLYFNISEISGITVWSAGDSWNFSTVGFDLWDGALHTIEYRRRGTEFQVVIDGVESALADFTPLYTGPNVFRIGDSNVRHDYFRGSILGLNFVDFVTPANTLNYQFDSGSLVYEMPNGYTGDETHPLAVVYQNITDLNWVCGNQWVEVGTDGIDRFGFFLGNYGVIYPTHFIDAIIYKLDVNTTTGLVSGQLGVDGSISPVGVTSWLLKVQGMVRELELVWDSDAGYFGIADPDGAAYIALNLGSKIKVQLTPVYGP